MKLFARRTDIVGPGFKAATRPKTAALEASKSLDHGTQQMIAALTRTLEGQAQGARR